MVLDCDELELLTELRLDELLTEVDELFTELVLCELVEHDELLTELELSLSSWRART